MLYLREQKMNLKCKKIHSSCDLYMTPILKTSPSNTFQYFLLDVNCFSKCAKILCVRSYRTFILICLVFIYSMPGYSCSIKERMLYSSCKAPLLEYIENNIGLQVEKKVKKGTISYVSNCLACVYSSA